MALSPGTRLGPYEITDLIGAGGMGEVYRARDPRLGRVVAIKVLGHDRCGHYALEARFEREARALSRLSHPNICAVYVTSFPALSGRWLIAEHRLLPRWSANGREIYFLTQDHATLFAADVDGDGHTFRISNVQRLFSVPLVAGRGYPYDVSSDGQRFVAVTAAGTITPLTLVVDWPSEIGR